jgi:16S rRNA (uracil1498-N3)-methyltransferase
MTATHKIQRLYISAPLNASSAVILEHDQTHYLRNVMRMDEGAQLRLFNGHDGEWRGEITQIGKKQTHITLHEQLKTQPTSTSAIHLLFAPIKKQRLDILIEKSVELGVTHLVPIITDHTENRHIKPERINAQIIEAAEQCERLDLPTLESAMSLKQKMVNWPQEYSDIPLLWCAERRGNAPHLRDIDNPRAFLIGPEGGFSADECALLEKTAYIQPIHLGTRILRAETAALFCLSHIKN